MSDSLENHPRVAIARTFLSKLGSAQAESDLQMLASDVSYRVVGEHALSGSFSGRREVAAHLAAILAQTDGRFDPVKWEDWMLGLYHVTALVDVHIEVGGALRRVQHLILVRFNVDELIDQVTVFFADPDVAFRLYGPKETA